MTKKFRPITPSLRKLVLNSFDELTPRSKPTKSLLRKRKRTNGRNHHGHITCRHRGGRHKRQFRLIDFKRDKENVPAKVAAIEYDPNRSAHIALLHYKDGEKRYMIAPQGLQVGDEVLSGNKSPYNVGCCMALKAMPLGSVVHNIELYPGKGGRRLQKSLPEGIQEISWKAL